jgi:hypothetical protein
MQKATLNGAILASRQKQRRCFAGITTYNALRRSGALPGDLERNRDTGTGKLELEYLLPPSFMVRR